MSWTSMFKWNIHDKPIVLNLEDITDADYIHAKRDCKGFGIKNLGEYHDLYPKRDTLLIFSKTSEKCV